MIVHDAPNKLKIERIWVETKKMWTDALGVFVLGRMWRSK